MQRLRNWNVFKIARIDHVIPAGCAGHGVHGVHGGRNSRSHGVPAAGVDGWNGGSDGRVEATGMPVNVVNTTSGGIRDAGMNHVGHSMMNIVHMVNSLHGWGRALAESGVALADAGRECRLWFWSVSVRAN